MIRTTKDGRTILTGIHYTEFRRAIYERAGQQCELCGKGLFYATMELHHRNGRGMGGGKRDDIPDEVLGICLGCHRAEHNQ